MGGAMTRSVGGANVSKYNKARQNDYWNKITQYNYKLFQLEKQELQQRKKSDQANLRQLLNAQIHSQRMEVSNQDEIDKKHVVQEIEKYRLENEVEKKKEFDKKME